MIQGLLSKNRWRWVVVFLLLFFFGRLLNTAAVKSVTYDEVIHIFAGAHYWWGERLYSVTQNPPLVNAIVGAPVDVAFDPTFPDSIEPVSDWLALSKRFMWEVNSNGLQMIWVGRLAIMWLATLLGALVYCWGRRLFQSEAAGLLALLLFTFDPNVLAHGYLATTDLGTAFFMAMAAYAVWVAWRRPWSWWRYGLAGLAVGLAFAAKFSGLILIPALLIMIVYRLATDRICRTQWRREVLALLVWLAIGGLVFLLVYRFHWDVLALDYSWQRQHQLDGQRSFLLGEFTRGVWYYFPILFAVKTPLPTLALLLVGLGLLLRRWRWRWEVLWPLLLAVGIAAAGVTSRVNIGYRYLLPAFPFLFVFLGQMASWRWVPGRIWRWGTIAAVMALIGTSLWIHPHYLAYFNQLGGGPENGWRLVVDSNVDWGQDLKQLGRYAEENKLSDLKSNLFGTAPLSAYRVPGETLLGWPARKDSADALRYDWFYPDWPQPGNYALSATQLQGLYLKSERSRFHWFRDRQPDDRVGYSIFVYEVAASGPPVGLGLSQIPIRVIDPADYRAAWGSNDVRPRWFDVETSFLWPGGGGATQVWTAVGDGHAPLHPLLAQFYADDPERTGSRSVGGTTWGYELYHWLNSPIEALVETAVVSREFGWAVAPTVGVAAWDEVRHPLRRDPVFGDRLTLLGYQLADIPAQPGRTLALLSLWRVERPSSDLKIFLHLLDAEGELVAQHDGFGVQMPGLQPGDAFAQLHLLPLPSTLPPGDYGLQLGVYERASLARLPVPVGVGQTTDRILLRTVPLVPTEVEP